MRNLVQADLIDNPKRDQWCATLAEALGYSINAIFAKLADRYALRMAIGGTWTERRHVKSAWENIVEAASNLKS